jgi:ribonuclease BN (tRNA processing enzyme)
MKAKVTFVGSGDAFGSGGRFQTCILVDKPGLRFAIDFGASSLIALNKLGIAHNSIDLILLTHIHGDHCGGIPLMLADAMLGAKRTTPLTIAGPRDTKARMAEVRDALMPGMHAMVPKFPLTFVEMDTYRVNDVCGLKVTPYPAEHTKETNPTGLRIDLGGTIISYTGDGDWTQDTPKLADGADLLICECYFYAKPVRFHLNYPTIKERKTELKAKQIVLTHLGPEMLRNRHLVPELCADDGMVMEI